MVDSGASDCLFPESIALALGIKMESGAKELRRGIGGNQDVWIHPVVLYIGSHALNINAAFCKTLPVAGLLGRKVFLTTLGLRSIRQANRPAWKSSA
jgi:hypothetical protein